MDSGSAPGARGLLCRRGRCAALHPGLSRSPDRGAVPGRRAGRGPGGGAHAHGLLCPAPAAGSGRGRGHGLPQPARHQRVEVDGRGFAAGRSRSPGSGKGRGRQVRALRRERGGAAPPGYCAALSHLAETELGQRGIVNRRPGGPGSGQWVLGRPVSLLSRAGISRCFLPGHPRSPRRHLSGAESGLFSPRAPQGPLRGGVPARGRPGDRL